MTFILGIIKTNKYNTEIHINNTSTEYALHQTHSQPFSMVYEGPFKILSGITVAQNTQIYSTCSGSYWLPPLAHLFSFFFRVCESESNGHSSSYSQECLATED